MLFELPLTENTSVAQVEIDVPAPYRGRGVGTALWQAAADRVAAEGRTIVQTEVNVAAGQSLQTSPGGRFASSPGWEPKWMPASRPTAFRGSPTCRRLARSGLACAMGNSDVASVRSPWERTTAPWSPTGMQKEFPRKRLSSAI